MRVLVMLEDVSGPSFKSLRQALLWYINHNPARAKYVNTLEVERGSKPASEDFTREHAISVWSGILQATRYVLRDFPDQQRIIFNLCELGRPFGVPIHPIEAAEKFGLAERTVYRWLRAMRKEIERELQSRGLLPRTDSTQPHRFY